MSNFIQTKKSLCDYIRAGVPFVVVRSLERQRVERIVRELAEENSFSLFCYTDAKQMQNFSKSSSGQARDVDSDPLAFCNEMFARSKHTTVVLGDTRRLNQDSLYARELLGIIHVARETKNTIVVVATEDVWSHLSHFGLFLELDFPEHQERLQLISEFASKFADKVSWSADNMNQLATLTRGLSEVQIVNLLRSSLVSRSKLGAGDIVQIASQKEQLFTPVSNVIPVSVGSELPVAGLENLMGWLDKKQSVLFADNDLLRQYDLEAPKGVLLVGVPGCGKSHSAKVVSAKWELPLYRFDIGSVYNKYVGETERIMHDALSYIDNVAPCVLWVDEIEKALSTSSGESDVGNRVLGQFLFWLQESTAKVFLVATANDVTKLPPELFRKGRFSEVFFVDLPNRRERMQAIDLYAKRSLHSNYDAADLEMLADVTEGFSYSDIEQAVKAQAEKVIFEGEAVPNAKDLAIHFEAVIPISVADDRIDGIRAWGVEHAVSASLEG